MVLRLLKSVADAFKIIKKSPNQTKKPKTPQNKNKTKSKTNSMAKIVIHSQKLLIAQYLGGLSPLRRPDYQTCPQQLLKN